jgi:hypothetical protein
MEYFYVQYMELVLCSELALLQNSVIVHSCFKNVYFENTSPTNYYIVVTENYY